jgi:hypothetical protein
MGVVYLAISHYKPFPGESFLASDFLRPIAMIDDLQYLDMTDLILEPSPLPLPTSTEGLCLTELRLYDMHNPQPLVEIFDLLPRSSVVIIANSAIGDAGPIKSDGHLTLEDIDADQDLVPLLRSWEGSYLSVSSCAGFSDTLLRTMAPRKDNIRNCAHDMTGLTIIDCSNFSVAELKQLVSAKLDAADGRRLRTLRFYGDVPVISEEDIEWFCENVDESDT